MGPPRGDLNPGGREVTVRQRDAPAGAISVWDNARVSGPGFTRLGMFESLSERLSGVLDKLTRRGSLTDSDVSEAMREVRRALLEADVALEVVRDFTDKVKAKAVGQNVIKSVTPGQMVVKIVHDELVAMLGSDAEPVSLNAQPPVAIMMVGLQGSGKTTTSAKIAWRLTNRDRKKVLMASLDTRRPAAQEQLRVLGEQTQVETLPIVAGQTPTQIARRAMDAARLGGFDVIILDTAGRTHIDEELMKEAADIRDIARPHETLLVADSLTGQDAVKLARSFEDAVGITGIVLTRVDGDGRGGAALSMRAVTGKPIKLIGVGEKWDALEDFHPERIAGRILGMGDVVSLVEKAAQNIDVEKAQAIAQKLKKGRVRPRGPVRSAEADGKARRHVGHDGPSARRCEGEEAARRRQHRRQDHQAAARDHLVHDAEGAPLPEDPRRQAQAPHRGRFRRQGRGGEPPLEDAPPDGGHDEDDGQARRPHEPHDGHGRRWRRTQRGRSGAHAGGTRGPRSQGPAEPAGRTQEPAAAGRRRAVASVEARAQEPAGPSGIARRRHAENAGPARSRWQSVPRLPRLPGEEEVSDAVQIPTLETERLLLRPWRESDLDDVAAFYADDATREVRRRRLHARRCLAPPGEHGRALGACAGNGPWALQEKATGRYVGWCGIWGPEGWPEPELMWSLMGPAHGKGYATEAATRARRFAYETLGWSTLISLIVPENVPSRRVAARLGARIENQIELRGYRMDVHRHPGRAQIKFN